MFYIHHFSTVLLLVVYFSNTYVSVMYHYVHRILRTSKLELGMDTFAFYIATIYEAPRGLLTINYITMFIFKQNKHTNTFQR